MDLPDTRQWEGCFGQKAGRTEPLFSAGEEEGHLTVGSA